MGQGAAGLQRGDGGGYCRFTERAARLVARGAGGAKTTRSSRMGRCGQRVGVVGKNELQAAVRSVGSRPSSLAGALPGWRLPPGSVEEEAGDRGVVVGSPPAARVQVIAAAGGHPALPCCCSQRTAMGRCSGARQLSAPSPAATSAPTATPAPATPALTWCSCCGGCRCAAARAPPLRWR